MRKLREDPKQHKLETSSQHWLEDCHHQFIVPFLHQVSCPSLGAIWAQARWVWPPSLTDVLCLYLLPSVNRRAFLPILSFLYCITSQTGAEPGNTRAPVLYCSLRFLSCTTAVGPDGSPSTTAARSPSLHVSLSKLSYSMLFSDCFSNLKCTLVLQGMGSVSQYGVTRRSCFSPFLKIHTYHLPASSTIYKFSEMTTNEPVNNCLCFLSKYFWTDFLRLAWFKRICPFQYFLTWSFHDPRWGHSLS